MVHKDVLISTEIFWQVWRSLWIYQPIKLILFTVLANQGKLSYRVHKKIFNHRQAIR